MKVKYLLLKHFKITDNCIIVFFKQPEKPQTNTHTKLLNYIIDHFQHVAYSFLHLKLSKFRILSFTITMQG